MREKQRGTPDKPRVLLYDAYYDSFYGAQQYLFDLVRCLTRVMPVVMCPQRGPLVEKLEAVGIQTLLLPYPDSLNRYRRTLLQGSARQRLRTGAALLAYNFRVRRRLEEEQIDLVYANNLRSLLSVGTAAKLSRRPLVWYIQLQHSSGPLDLLGLHLADRVVTISHSARSLFSPQQQGACRDKLVTIHPGIELAPFAREPAPPASQGAGADAQELTIGVVAVLAARKGQHRLIEALRVVLPRLSPRYRLRLWLIGDALPGDEGYKQELITQVRAAGLDEVITFLGWRDDVPQWLARLDVLVLPSSAEGVPRALLEGMAAGKPVIATRVGGVPELVVDGQTGYLVPPDDVPALAEALCRLIQDPDRAQAMGRAGQRRAEAFFSVRPFAERFDSLFLSMIQAGGTKVSAA